MGGYYILDGHTPIRTQSVIAWAEWHEDHDRRRVALTAWGDDVRVSTVFLGLDHNFGSGPPILFETMVFANGHPSIDEDTRRYATWGEALHGHRAIVAELASVFGPPLKDDAPGELWPDLR